LREIRPKDFYWFAVVENDYPDLSESHRTLLILVMLLEANEEDLMKIPARCLQPIIWWMSKNLLEERIMKLDSWLSTAFHLQKERWDSSIEWLEQQPMPKILLMINIQSKFAEEQSRKMKQSGKKK